MGEIGCSLYTPIYVYVASLTFGHKGSSLEFYLTVPNWFVQDLDMFNDSHPFTPINPYGKNKLTIEFALQDYSTAYDLKCV